MRASAVLLSLLAGSLALACGSTVSLEDLACPCASGFVCCEQVCVAEGSCGDGKLSVAGSDDAASDLPGVDPGGTETSSRGGPKGFSSADGGTGRQSTSMVSSGPLSTSTNASSSSTYRASTYSGTDDGGTGRDSSRDARPSSADAGVDARSPDAQPRDTGVDVGSPDAIVADRGACEAACQAVAIACGESDAGAAASCAGLCSSGATTTQLMCLATTACAGLEATQYAGGTVCGIGEVEAGAPQQGGGSALLEGCMPEDGAEVSYPWIWDGANWTAAMPFTDPGWQGSAMATLNGTPVYLADINGCETWTWAGGQWNELHPVSNVSECADATMAPLGNVLVLFGGGYGGAALNDTWTWDGSTWTQLGPATSPPPRLGAMMATLGSNVVLFGGTGEGIDGGAPLLNDTWTWDGTAWNEQHPPVSPPPRSGGVMATLGSEVVLFGGTNSDTSDLGDTWTWDGTTWTERESRENPPPRIGASMATSGNTVVLFGGGVLDGVAENVVYFLADTWVWDGADWTKMIPNVSPPACAFASMSAL
ncbi:MAG: kelch repeat-containing protein [Polyangiaceae bacterium]